MFNACEHIVYFRVCVHRLNCTRSYVVSEQGKKQPEKKHSQGGRKKVQVHDPMAITCAVAWESRELMLCVNFYNAGMHFNECSVSCQQLEFSFTS